MIRKIKTDEHELINNDGKHIRTIYGATSPTTAGRLEKELQTIDHLQLYVIENIASDEGAVAALKDLLKNAKKYVEALYTAKTAMIELYAERFEGIHYEEAIEEE